MAYFNLLQSFAEYEIEESENDLIEGVEKKYYDDMFVFENQKTSLSQ